MQQRFERFCNLTITLVYKDQNGVYKVQLRLCSIQITSTQSINTTSTTTTTKTPTITITSPTITTTATTTKTASTTTTTTTTSTTTTTTTTSTTTTSTTTASTTTVSTKEDSMSGIAGSGLPFDNMQPSLVLTQIVPLSITFPLCAIRTFACNFAPGNSLLTYGQLLPIASNTAIFSIMGTTYGGDGKKTFALPNLQGITIIGSGQGSGLSPYRLGEQTGSQQVTLTKNQMPAHVHSIPSSIDFTGVTGSSQSFSSIQPSLAMSYLICISGVFPSAGSSVGQLPFIGQIVPYTGNVIPTGWALADGSLLSIASDTALFPILGTTYGGDGVTNFRLPDLQGRVPVGVSGNLQGRVPVGVSGSLNTQIGNTIGVESVTLLTNNLPSHVHSLVGSKYNATQTGVTGAGQTFDNRQPGLGITYLITMQGVFPSQGGTGPEPMAPYLGEIVAFAGNFQPGGYAFANDQLLSISQNTALFVLLGTTYGGNGITSFALPDLRGRVILGSGRGFSIGQTLGSSLITLTADQMPSHAHSLSP
ncbi:unnamed protein product [Rotaria socialis]|uniref:Phage tail collar domain-containing protein n=1 Tax=Rotaria socialis TaxID=392032 RepID=A0A818XFP1_9BILA|nr:unnamed protein product [Rotaria socialis]